MPFRSLAWVTNVECGDTPLPAMPTPDAKTLALYGPVGACTLHRGGSPRRGLGQAERLAHARKSF